MKHTQAVQEILKSLPVRLGIEAKFPQVYTAVRKKLPLADKKTRLCGGYRLQKCEFVSDLSILGVIRILPRDTKLYCGQEKIDIFSVEETQQDCSLIVFHCLIFVGVHAS